MKRVASVLVVVVAVLTLGRPAAAGPLVIQYTATDLTDLVTGEDLWRYQYDVSNLVFQADQGFSIFFDYTLYKNLESPPPTVNADWDVLSFQPDTALASDGLYDTLALVNGAALADPFVLSFVWLGAAGTAPGSQPFTVNQYDPLGNLTVIDSGRTVAAGGPGAVPEPSTLLLLATGCGALLSRRVRHWRDGRARRF